MKRNATFLFLVVATVFVAVSTSFAHAQLVASSPLAGELAPVAPSSVSLQFNLRVQSSMSSIEVKDSSGGSISTGSIVESDQGKRISVSLPRLASGSYRVAWQALSADDHLIEGRFEFSIGNLSEPVPTDLTASEENSGKDHSAHESEQLVNWPRSLVRWLMYIGMMLLTGGLGFRLFVLGGGKVRNETLDPLLTKFLAGAALLIVFGLLAALLFQTQMVTGSVGMSQAMAIVSKTSFGPPWLFQLLAATGSFIILVFASSNQQPSRRFPFWMAFGLSVLGLLGPSLSGHARAAWDEYSLAIASDWLHLIAGSMWIGGLCGLAFTIAYALAENDRQAALASLSATMKRFTSLVIPATILLAITGLYNTWIHVESLSALVGTTYGIVLLVKVAISGFMIVLGGINAFVLHPRLVAESRAAADAEGSRLFSSVRIEILLAMTVLLLAAVLAFLPPAREHITDSAIQAPAIQEAR